MFSKYPLVYVEWDDHACNDSGWQSDDDIHEAPANCCSVGWLYKETSKKLILIGSYILDDNFEKRVSEVQHILKDCVTKQVILRKAGSPRKRKRHMMVAEELPGEVEAIAIGNGSER